LYNYPFEGIITFCRSVYKIVKRIVVYGEKIYSFVILVEHVVGKDIKDIGNEIGMKDSDLFIN